MSIRWLLWSLLSPSQLLLGTVMLGALLLALGRSKVGRWLTILGGAAIFVLGLLPTAHYLIYPLENRFSQPELPAAVAGIVLMAGAERAAATEEYGEPQLNSLAARYTTTLRLARRYPDAKIVFTGGPPVNQGTGSPGQTSVAMKLLTTVGLDNSRLSFEAKSADTCDSAANTKALAQPAPDETWVVVTSAFHVPRTMACFRAVGWEVVPQPADYRVVVGGWNTGSFRVAENLALLDAAAHEWLGLIYYRLSGRTDELFPSQ